jgi:hypothetical protein
MVTLFQLIMAAMVYSKFNFSKFLIHTSAGFSCMKTQIWTKIVSFKILEQGTIRMTESSWSVHVKMMLLSPWLGKNIGLAVTLIPPLKSQLL